MNTLNGYSKSTLTDKYVLTASGGHRPLADSEFIVGTQTAATGSWTGVSIDSELYDGKQISYWLPFNGSGNATLNLTLAGGSTTGAVNCYYGGTSRLTTHYGAGNIIRLVYRENVNIGETTYTGWWADANYTDGNTYTSAWCGTAAATAAKTATCSNYTLRNNSYIHVLIRHTNTAASALTLNINSTGAKPIYINGVASSKDNYSLYSGTYIVFFDGTNYYFNTDSSLPGKIKDSSILWGTDSIAGDISPIDSAASYLHSGNKLLFAKPEGITIEYSTNGGSTWIDYGTTNVNKIGLVSGLYNKEYIIGKGLSTKALESDLLRITLHATNMGVYTRAKSLLIDLTTSGSNNCKVKVEIATKGNPSSFSTRGEYPVEGWSGWNRIPLGNMTFGGMTGLTSHIEIIRLTFTTTGTTKETGGHLTILSLLLLGVTNWITPSNMAKTGHLYSWDSGQNAIFPALVTATLFNGPLNGNAASATKLKTKRKLWGLEFDGSADVSGDMTGVGNVTMNGDILINAENNDRYLIFSYDNLDRHSWRLGYLGTGTGAANYFVLQGTKTATGGNYTNALYFDNSNFNATFAATVTATTFKGNLDGTYVNALTDYVKATSAEDLVTADTLNTALGKLEYKADTAYDWIISVTTEDTDKYVNKWQEILDFLNKVDNTEGADITDEFVTRKTDLTITGQKNFNTNTNSVPLVLSRNGLNTKECVSIGVDDGTVVFNHIQDEKTANYTFKGTWLDTENSDGSKVGNHAVYFNLGNSGASIKLDTYTVYHTGNLTNLSQLTNDCNFVTGGPYLPLAGGTMDNGAEINLSLYTTRKLNITGNKITFDTSTATGGWTGGIYLNHLESQTKGILTWLGDKTALTLVKLCDIDVSTLLHAGNYTTYTVKKDGTGASGTWGINISGSAAIANRLALNGIADSTTYGTYAGIIQANTGGPESESWHNSLKILHNNSSGYYTQLAQNFTGTHGLWHRSNRAGTISRWYKVIDDLGGAIYGKLSLLSNSGDSPHLVFQRGTTTDDAYDWDMYVTAGYFKVRYNNAGTWSEILSLYPGSNLLEGYQILTAGNSSVSGGGSTWGSSITVNIGGTSKTLTIPAKPTIPTVTDYYWANIKVSSTESTTTTPTFGSTVTLNSTGNVILNLTRTSKSSWRFLNDANLRIQNNYTSEVVDYFDVVKLACNTGNVTLKGSLTASSNSGTVGIPLVLKNTGWYGGMSTAMDFYNGRTYTVPNARIETKMNGDGRAGGTLIFYTLTAHATTNPNPNGLTERLRIGDNGIITITGQIEGSSGGTWIKARNNAVVKQICTTSSTYQPVVSMKTASGSWSMGTLGNTEKLIVSYDTDENYNANTNSNIAIYFPTSGGTLALTSQIPTKTSQLTNDSNFITSRGYIGTTPVLSSLAEQSLSGIINITATGNYTSAVSTSTSLYLKLANKDTAIGLRADSGTVRGVYDYGKSKWLVYSDGIDGTVLLGHVTTSNTWSKSDGSTGAGIKILNAVGSSPTGALSSYSIGLEVSGYYSLLLASKAGVDDTLYFKGALSTGWVEILHKNNLGNTAILYDDNIDTTITYLGRAGYGYTAKGWKVAGPAIAIGSSNGYTALILLSAGSSTLYVSHKANGGAVQAWNQIAFISDLTWANITGKPTIPSLSLGTTTGSGNAVTSISVSDHTITLNKETTFLTHQSLANCLRSTAWVDNPGHDADTMADNTMGFTYSNNAPYTGPIIYFAGASGGYYGMLLNASYYGKSISFRTRNGDNGTWNSWDRLARAEEIPTKVSQLENDSNYVTGGPYLPLSGGKMTGTIKSDTTTILKALYGTNADGTSKEYTILENHKNGNVSLSAASGGLYLGYYNTTAIYCRGSYTNIDSGNWSSYITIPTLYLRNICINNRDWTVYSPYNTNTDRIYAPTTSGSGGDLLISDGEGSTPVWTSPGNVTVGGASKADKLTVARTIALSGAVTGSASFNGSADITIATSVNHTHSYIPLSGTTGLTGSIVMQGDSNTVPFVRNLTLSANSGWDRSIMCILVDGSSKFTIGAYGDYTKGSSSNGIGYAYIGCNGHNGLNLRITADSLKWGADTILHAGNWSSYITIPTIPTLYERNIGINGNNWTFSSPYNTATTSIYAPTSAGTSGQVLVSTGGIPTWLTISTSGGGGYIGTTAVQSTSQTQNLTGIGGITANSTIQTTGSLKGLYVYVNSIYGNTSTGMLIAATSSIDLSAGDNALIYISNAMRAIYTTRTTPASLGLSNAPWGALYAASGTFTGNISANGGSFYTNANGAYHTSDIRKKTNITKARNLGIADLLVEFDWKDSSKHSWGYIAQDLLEVLPEAVDYNEDIDVYSVNYNVAHSAAIASLTARIKELEEKLKKYGIL